MSKLEEKLLKWNFKKIAIAYIIAVIVIGIACTVVTGIVFNDRISFAWQYSRLSEAAEKNSTESLKPEIDSLAEASGDVVDILMLDANNQVIYSAKNSEFGTGTLQLQKTGEEKRYLVSDQAPDVLFRVVKGDEFLLGTILNKDFGEIRHEYDDESFFETEYADKTVYMLSYIKEHRAGSKIYVISSPTTVAGGETLLKADASIVMLLFMIYWVLVALWVFKNAAKAKLYPIFWGIIVLFTNLAGVVVYLLYKRGNAVCESCGASQSRENVYCTSCGAKIGKTCEGCGAHLMGKEAFCPRCGEKTE